MKYSTISFFAVLSVLFGMLVVSSCSKSDRFAGVWQGNQERIDNVREASDASTTVTLDFAPSQENSGTGTVSITAVIEVEQPVNGTFGLDEAYQTNVSATASITGRYVTEDNDDDDIIITFDPSSLKVNVDPDGVTFSENVATGMQQSMLDSLTEATADHWRAILTPVMRDVFGRYTKIEDIKVHHSDFLSCEVADRDYTFRRVGVND